MNNILYNYTKSHTDCKNIFKIISIIKLSPYYKYSELNYNNKNTSFSLKKKFNKQNISNFITNNVFNKCIYNYLSNDDINNTNKYYLKQLSTFYDHVTKIYYLLLYKNDVKMTTSKFNKTLHEHVQYLKNNNIISDSEYYLKSINKSNFYLNWYSCNEQIYKFIKINVKIIIIIILVIIICYLIINDKKQENMIGEGTKQEGTKQEKGTKQEGTKKIIYKYPFLENKHNED